MTTCKICGTKSDSGMKGPYCFVRRPMCNCGKVRLAEREKGCAGCGSHFFPMILEGTDFIFKCACGAIWVLKNAWKLKDA